MFTIKRAKLLVIPRAKRANEVSECSEWNGREFMQKNFSSTAHIGVGGCPLSVCPSICLSVYVTLLNNF
jgi:hypothetical protein